jgi:hypothetical protein
MPVLLCISSYGRMSFERPSYSVESDGDIVLFKAPHDSPDRRTRSVVELGFRGGVPYARFCSELKGMSYAEKAGDFRLTTCPNSCNIVSACSSPSSQLRSPPSS